MDTEKNKDRDLFLNDPNLYNIINHEHSMNDPEFSSVKSEGSILVPTQYRIKVPKLVWESKTVTWHGHNLQSVTRLLRESLSDGLHEVAIQHMTELLASGYLTELWDILWETFFMEGLPVSEPSLAVHFLKEYKYLRDLKKKVNSEDIVNNQIYRNHLCELLTIFAIFEHKTCPNDLLYDGTDLIMEPIKDDLSRTLSQEYILMSKTVENTCVELEELHYNLSKFLEAVRIKPPKISDIQKNFNYEQTFFWIYEIVKMNGIRLKSNLQNYFPKGEEEWTSHPSNIIWNYFFIRAPNKLWGTLGTLMEIYTIHFKRKQSLTCATILMNVLQLINNESLQNNQLSETKSIYIRSRHPLVIQTVMKINNIMHI